MRNDERGVMLLDAMIAIAILASAGVSMVALLGQALRMEHTLRAQEHDLHGAARVLTAAAMLTRRDLDRRLGRHPVGEFALEVQRPRPTLYRLAVIAEQTPTVEMLVTVVYRPELTTP